MKEPVDHIVRPRLPWRAPSAPAITECGFDASKVQAISRDEYFLRFKEMGRQRCALMTCMTCGDTARRWGTWADDPRFALQREIEWERGSYYRARSDRGELLKDELTAVAALIASHQDEFDAAVMEIQRRRDWNEKKAALSEKRPGAHA